MDINKIREISKKASARIKSLEAQNKALRESSGRQKKYASLIRGRKVGEVVSEVVEDVKEKLQEMEVPEEAVEQAAEIVETAVAEAVSAADPAAADAGADAVPAEGDVIDKETKEELAQVAASDEIDDEEIKSAALKLLKSCNSKQAFGKELVRMIKKMSAGNFTGSVITRHNAEAGTGRKSSALTELKEFARGTAVK